MSTISRTPDEIKQEVKQHYGQFAAKTLAAEPTKCCEDSCGSPLYPNVDLSGVPETAVLSSRGCGNPQAIADLKPGEIVLDLGCGGGLDVLLAARQVGAQGFVYGVDMTDEMLDLARTNAARAGVTHVEFRKGELEALPLPDGTVDVIISNCVVNLTPDKGHALEEAYRVLKPGGRLAISDIVVDGDLKGLPVSEEQIRAGLSWAGCIAGALSRDEFQRLLQAAGFVDIEITVAHRYRLDELLGEMPGALQKMPQAVLEELVQRFTSSNIRARK